MFDVQTGGIFIRKQLCGMLAGIFLVFALSACTNSAPSPETIPSKTQAAPNSFSQVASITRQARDAANAATENDISTAYEYIKSNYTDCFKDNATMEQMMYYGWLLEYTYEGDTEKQDYYTLGQDAEQLVKYVYRGTDTADSDSTTASMEQIQHTIAAMQQGAAEQTAQQSASTDTSKENSRTVYITKTGKKYHYANPCGKGTYYPCSLAEAQSRGLEPCGKCVLR